MIWLNIAFIITSIVLVASILIQNRSAGLSSAFGGGSDGFHVRRGSEKQLFRLTVISGALFLILAFAHLII